MVDYENIVQTCVTRAHELALAGPVTTTEDAASAFASQVQGLLEVAKIAAQLDAVRDARIMAARQATARIPTPQAA